MLLSLDKQDDSQDDLETTVTMPVDGETSNDSISSRGGSVAPIITT